MKAGEAVLAMQLFGIVKKWKVAKWMEKGGGVGVSAACGQFGKLQSEGETGFQHAMMESMFSSICNSFLKSLQNKCPEDETSDPTSDEGQELWIIPDGKPESPPAPVVVDKEKEPWFDQNRKDPIATVLFAMFGRGGGLTGAAGAQAAGEIGVSAVASAGLAVETVPIMIFV